MSKTSSVRPAGIVFSIGSPAGDPNELHDNYKEPSSLDGLTWRTWDPDAKRKWPLFHASEADPDGGYRIHPYTIEFQLDRVATSYQFSISYLVIAPRVAHLELEVNGVMGKAYLRPRPSGSGEIRLHAGLHASIYSEGTIDVLLPGALLRQGLNRLTLTARDGGEVARVDNPEAIKRLDRMANGAGFIYQHLRLSESIGEYSSSLRRAVLEPSVVYTRDGAEGLRERAVLDLEFARPVGGGALELAVSEGNDQETCRVEVPAIPFGHFRQELSIFDGEGDVSYSLTGHLDGSALSVAGKVRRRRKWKVYISPHSHTDIGYTHRQWEVAERHNRNIDFALEELARQDRSTPESRSFAYHLDAAWPVENWLATRSPDRQRELMSRIAEGSVSVAGNYADLLTQFSALEDLIRNLEFADGLLRPLSKRAELAAFVDVASLTGSLPAVLSGANVRYLVHANNQDRGPFRLNGGLHRVSPFWWEGTAGGRVLCWLARMYCELRKVCGSPPGRHAAASGLDMWLQEFERQDYQPDAVLLYGQEADNTDLDPQPVEFVREWNEQHAYPRLIAGDVTDFFRYVEGAFGDGLATVRGDGGAYWEDGVTSSLAATMAARAAQAALPAAERLEALAVVHGEGRAFPSGNYDQAWRELLLYDEHTWGAFLSGTDPESRLARDQWRVKENMARQAQAWASRLLHEAATRHSLNWNNDGREVVVYNPHGWTVSGPVTVEIARGEEVLDAAGRPIPARVVESHPSQQIVELWIEAMQPFSYRRLALRTGSLTREPAAAPADGVSARLPAGTRSAPPLVTLSSSWYRLVFDGSRGAVGSLLDLELDRELVDGREPWGLGRLVYAQGGEGTRLVSNQSGLPEGNPSLLADFDLESLTVEEDELAARLRASGRVACGRAELEWSLSRHRKGVELRVRLDKLETSRKEALYVAFPLAQPPDAAVLSDSQLGWVDWHRGELPGGCKEWLPLQTSILSRGAEVDILVNSPDIPLFCSGDVVRGRWPKELDLRGGRIFSYVLNNYWHTNYKASQGGVIEFRYLLTSATQIGAADAYRQGWQERTGLYAQRISYQDFRSAKEPYLSRDGGTFALTGSDDIAITTIRPARWGEGWFVRFQEIGGRDTLAAIRFPGQRVTAAWETDLLGHDRRELEPDVSGGVNVPVPAWGLTSVRVLLARAEERQAAAAESGG